jgi:all-trans-retinol 13,14-reductase
MPKRYFHRYNKDLQLESYDHIIIGSGMAGLTLAASLAHFGETSLILEKHHKPGGFTHSFKRKLGYQWDVGVHYVGGLGKNRQLSNIFNFLSNDELEWESLGDVYDVIRVGNDSYDFVSGKKKHIAKLKEYFPEEEKAIDQYFEIIFESIQANQNFFLEKVFPPFLSKAVGGRMNNKFLSYSRKTTYEVMKSITDNERLITVLCAQCGDYGLPPRKSSFAIHAMIVNHFIFGAYYPKGGADRIAHYISKKIEAQGCKVYVNAGVDEIVVKDDQVAGVKIGDRFVAAKSVISTVGVNNTFKHLMSAELSEKCGYSLKNVKASTGHLCLYLGLDQSDEELGLPKHNIWSYEHDNIDQVLDEITTANAGQKFAYLSFPSAKDSEWQEKHPHKATIQALSLGKFEWFEKFQDQTVMKREEAYDAMKKEFEESMLKKLIELYPQIEGHIVVSEVSTPLSTQTYCNYEHGEIYGIDHTPERFDLPILRVQTKIKGLRLAGQDIVTAGVGGALMSGILCAASILKFRTLRLFKEIARFQKA